MNRAEGHSLAQQLHLTSKDTSTALALYYVGYIIFDVPMNLIMTKVSPQTWLARIVITVGLVYTCYHVYIMLVELLLLDSSVVLLVLVLGRD